MIQSIHISNIGETMMKKTLYLFSLLCLIGAPLAHGEIVIFSGITNSDFCKRAEDETPID